MSPSLLPLDVINNAVTCSRTFETPMVRRNDDHRIAESIAVVQPSYYLKNARNELAHDQYVISKPIDNEEQDILFAPRYHVPQAFAPGEALCTIAGHLHGLCTFPILHLG